MKESLILIGGGGHCKSCIDVIESENRFEIAGIVDLQENLGAEISGYPVIGVDDDLPELAKEHKHFFITMGYIKSPVFREKMFTILEKLGVNIPVIISPSAQVSKSSLIGRGTIVMHHTLVNAEAKIGINCIINSGAIVEHEAVVGNHCHISTRAVLNGQCIVGSSCFIGSGTIMANNISVSDNVIVSAGSLLLRSIDRPGVYIGNPLRKIR